VHPKGADSMAISGLCFRNALVGSRWTTAALQCTNGLRNSPLTMHVPISGGEAPLGERLPAECHDKLING